MRLALIFVAIFCLTECEGEAAKRQRLEALVEKSTMPGNEGILNEITNEERQIVLKILDDKMKKLSSNLSENQDLTSRLVGYAIENKARADALTATCEATHGSYSDVKNTEAVAQCVDDAW